MMERSPSVACNLISRILLLICLVVVSYTSSFSQINDELILRQNQLKVNIIPIIPTLSGQSQQWLGFEYQRYINSKLSVSALLNIGLFEDYSFKKYYDFFNQNQGFSYSEKTVLTRGYHIIPSVKYYFILIQNRPVQGFYTGGKIDFNQYFKTLETYNSISGETGETKYTISRLGIGPCLGFQYIFFSRLSLDIDLSFFIRVFENYSIDEQVKTPPINAFWKTEDDSMWMTVQFMIGYAFGGGSKQKSKRKNEL